MHSYLRFDVRNGHCGCGSRLVLHSDSYALTLTSRHRSGDREREGPNALIQPHRCRRATDIIESLRTILQSISGGFMRLPRWSSLRLSAIVVLCALSSAALAQTQSNVAKKKKNSSCTQDNSGLTLPEGFCATVFADGIGHARHVVVGPSGALYVNTWSGDY